MKYFGVFVLLCCFLGAVLAQRKNPICAEEFAVAGPCRSIIPNWSYNQKTGECSPFNYSGCQGTANRFATPEECERNCKPQIL